MVTMVTHWLIEREESPQLFLADAHSAAIATSVRDNQRRVDPGNRDVTQVRTGRCDVSPLRCDVTTFRAVAVSFCRQTTVVNQYVFWWPFLG